MPVRVAQASILRTSEEKKTLAGGGVTCIASKGMEYNRGRWWVAERKNETYRDQDKKSTFLVRKTYLGARIVSAKKKLKPGDVQ